MSPIQRHTYTYTPSLTPTYSSKHISLFPFIAKLFRRIVYLHYLHFLPFGSLSNTLYFTKSSLVKTTNHLHVAKSNGYYSVPTLPNLSAAFTWLSFYLSVYSYLLCRLFLAILDMSKAKNLLSSYAILLSR